MMIKKLLLSVLFIFAVGVFYLFTQSQNLMEIESEIEIAAPVDKVWAVITGIEKWSEFNSHLASQKKRKYWRPKAEQRVAWYWEVTQEELIIR